MLPTRKILLSETARGYLDLEAAFLRRAGFEVLAAAEGPQVLEVLEREKPELCVLDLQMPGVPGDEVVKRVRSQYGKHGGPAFILVSAGGPEGYERCLRSGADEIFTEPFSKEELLKKAAALLRIPRRVFARVLVRFEVEGQQASRVPFFGSSVNLSRGGVLLETLESVDVGTDLRLGFFLPGYHTRVSCRGTVVRREPAEGGFTRYGVRFVDLPDLDARAVEDFVRRRD